MASVTAQLNARIDSTLKRDGDEVFARYGLNPSEVVRAVWSYAAENQKPPAFMTRASDDGKAKELERKLALIKQGAGLMASPMGRPEIIPLSESPQAASGNWADSCKSLRDAHYDELASKIRDEWQEAHDV